LRYRVEPRERRCQLTQADVLAAMGDARCAIGATEHASMRV
jgi:hypothetical protein